MKKVIIHATIVIIFLAVSLTGISRPHPLNFKKSKEVLSAKNFTGYVSGWSNNEDYIYNGFYLQTESNKYLIKFPLYLGRRLQKAICEGTTVTVTGDEITAYRNHNEISFECVTVNGIKLTCAPIKAEAKKEKEQTYRKIGEARVKGIEKDDKGKPKALILDDNTLLYFPSSLKEQLYVLAVPGADVFYRGSKKCYHTGEVVVSGYIAINGTTIIISGQQITFR